MTSWCSSDLHKRKRLPKENSKKKKQGDLLVGTSTGLQILETKFINCSLDNMDDMVFQNNNKNAIYVLNTSYNTYGEFGRPNAFGYPQSSSDEIYNNPKNCSLLRSLHKLKSLRYHSTEIISGGASNAMESNSSSTTSCSPATTALQKLFNCSSTAHSCKSIIYKNNNNCHSNSHINNHDLSHHGSSNDSQHNHFAHQETGKLPHLVHPQLEYHHLENQMSLSLRGNINSTSGKSCVLPCVVNAKKKDSTSTTSVKSTLIAKKTKFWKYLVEEEKWRKHSDENLSTANCERDRESFTGQLSSYNHTNANDNQKWNNNAYVDGSCTQAINRYSSKSNSRSCNGNNSSHSNWSGYDDTNKNSNINQKSSAQLYKEAAQLLGLSCTLCDNCRCLDCQSRYFECDDSDSYSEFSFMDEYFESLPPDVGRNFRDFSSTSQESSQDETASASEDQLMSTEPENNALGNNQSLHDKALENFIENEK